MKKIIVIAITILTLGLSTSTFAENEGIQVHGHWTFDIYNADGSFDRKVEFDNALTTRGADLLLKLLLGRHKSVDWNILLNDSSNDSFSDGLCWKESIAVYKSCNIFNVNAGLDNNYPSLATKLTLTGNITINEDPTDLTNLTPGNITEVDTQLFLECVDPTDTQCSISQYNFTSKTGLSITVTGGQIVQVKVEISFS